jgi:hypothetical protein
MKKHSVDGQNFLGNRKEECLMECLCHQPWSVIFSLHVSSFEKVYMGILCHSHGKKEGVHCTLYSFVCAGQEWTSSHQDTMKDGWFVDRKLFHSILVSEGHIEPAPTSPPSTVIITQLWMNLNWVNRVIRKVRKTQHKNPEFGLTQVRLQKSTLALRGVDNEKTIAFGGKLGFILSFPFSWAPPLLLHIFSLLLPEADDSVELMFCYVN